MPGTKPATKPRTRRKQEAGNWTRPDKAEAHKHGIPRMLLQYAKGYGVDIERVIKIRKQVG